MKIQGTQKGMALVVGLMLLLVITLLAVSMMRSSTLQERMSANNQQQTITFQGAEAAIRNVMDELRGIKAPPAGTTQSVLITALNNGTAPTAEQLTTATRTVDLTSQTTDGNNTTNAASLTYVNTTISAGSSMGIGSGSSVLNYNFVVEGTSTQANTGAFSRHQQGIARQGPGAS